MKNFILDFIKWFLIINTGIMVVVWFNIQEYDSIWSTIIPQIFGASFLSSLVTTLFFSFNPKRPILVSIRILLILAHYAALCIIIMMLGVCFNWFELTVKGGFIMAASVAGVYFIAALISFILSKGEADEMTKALKNYKDE